MLQIRPEFAKRVDVVPNGAGWLHEVKYDGYRIVARLRDGRVHLKTRNDLDWTDRFPEITATLGKLPVDTAVLDGEVVVLNEQGLSSFSALQKKLSQKAKKGYIYLAFDLLFLNGVDIRGFPLLARKKTLQALLLRKSRSRLSRRKSFPVQFANHQLGHGDKVFKKACRQGFEGIISKRIDSPYRAGRSGDWIKTKCCWEEEFVIGGFTDPRRTRAGFGALLLGYWSDGKFSYAGRVGTGFDSRALASIYKALKTTEIEHCPFSTNLSSKEKEGAHYVTPRFVAQVKYSEWTADKRLRQPVFLGIREDKSASEVNRAA